MRFKKGSKVEVLTQKEVPSGSWRCTEIICGNGHYYTVRYDGDVGSFGKAMVERVRRKAIRPCPPSVDVMGDWVAGDVVEVFHNYSWKMATVLMVSGWSHLLVRLLGSAIEIKAHKYDVRARLCFQDGEWIVIGKKRKSTKNFIQEIIDASPCISRPLWGACSPLFCVRKDDTGINDLCSGVTVPVSASNSLFLEAYDDPLMLLLCMVAAPFFHLGPLEP